MKQFALFLFVLVHLSKAYVDLEKCLIDNRSLQNAWEERLREKIMCNYSPLVPPKPINGSNFIVATLRFVVKSFKFVSAVDEFSMTTFGTLKFVDERLKWDPRDYDGLDKTVVHCLNLWLPGISLANTIDDQYDQGFDPFTECRISSDGLIEFFTSLTLKAKCATNLSDWPLDIQVCPLQFKAWHERGTPVHLDFTRIPIVFNNLYGAEWDIMKYTQEENQGAEKQLSIYFTMKRHSEILEATVIYPSILLCVLTIFTLFLDARRTIRLYVACFNLACYFYFLSVLGMAIPAHTKNPPRILFFFRGSFIINFTSIILTYLLKYICENEASVPKLIVMANEFANKSYIKFIIRPRWEATNEDASKCEILKAWTNFANILNSVWIFVVLIVYIVMCCVFIPTPRKIEQEIPFIHY